MLATWKSSVSSKASSSSVLNTPKRGNFATQPTWISSMLPRSSTRAYTLLALLAFSSNQILCRCAMAKELIDWSSFTFVRLVSGVLILGALWPMRRRFGEQCEPGTKSQAAITVVSRSFFAQRGLRSVRHRTGFPRFRPARAQHNDWHRIN